MRLRLPGRAAIVLALSAAACGGGEAPPAAPAPGAVRVDGSKAGSLTGRVLVEGAVPANATIKPSSDPYCMRASEQGFAAETYVVENGGLENVFVYVKDGLGNYHFDIPTEPVKLDQQGCRYLPHVIGVRAGQPIEITNSDETLHNVHALADINQEFNIGQPKAGMKNTRTFTAQEVMVTFKCDVHAWMNAYAGVMSHPYFAVTSGGGTFEMKNLPAGTYTIEAWHERLGRQTATVTLAAQETKEIAFTFKMGS